MKRRLTVPQEMNLARRLFPTGNHFVSLPVISGEDASVDRIGVLHLGTAGLIEFGGVQSELGAETLPAIEPFLRPIILSPEGRIRLSGHPAWTRSANWVPSFDWTGSGPGGEELRLRGTIFAPVRRDSEGLQSHKGFVYVLELTGPRKATYRIGLELVWGDLLHTVYTSRRLPAGFTVRSDRWTGGPVFEPVSGAGPGPVALAVAFSASPGEVSWTATGPADGFPGGRATVRTEMTVSAAAGPTAFYFGVNREGDGARTTAVDLGRHGWETLLKETGTALEAITRPVRDGLPEGPALRRALNDNLMFNYFYAAGRTIDTEDLVLVTSRSPLYYVSAAFWARDALLWSFPGLLLADPVLAEEALGQAFERYFRHAGIHSLYINGTLLYPGFELDELAAYPIALQRYIETTGDAAIIARRGLVDKIRRVLSLMEEHAHPDPHVHLYRTFLQPSDDPVVYPYLTYDNVMAWSAVRAAAGILERAGAPAQETASLRRKARDIREAIDHHCVTDGPRGPILAWSVDLAGAAEIGDEPPGSLELLPYYGFCLSDEPIWRRTMDWVHSGDNPYRYREVRFPGVGCAHSPHPFVMSLFNALLGGLPERVAEAVAVLAAAPLDNGLACEAYDRDTGEVKTGAAFATCAGFLAYAIWRVFGDTGMANTGMGRSPWNTGA